MLRVPIRSRLGNRVLGLLGVVYFVASATILVYYIVNNWGAMTLTDDVLQMGLVVAAIGGLLFILIAMQNLAPRAAAKSRSARDRQEAAAAGS